MGLLSLSLSLSLPLSWTLIASSHSSSTDLEEFLHIQSNGTSEGVNVSNGSQGVSFLQQVTGSSDNSPPWAAWLTPLSNNTQNVTFSWPKYGNYVIPAGKTYYYGYKYSLETGYQDWSLDGARPTQIHTRNRFWKTNDGDFEYHQ